MDLKLPGDASILSGRNESFWIEKNDFFFFRDQRCIFTNDVLCACSICAERTCLLSKDVMGTLMITDSVAPWWSAAIVYRFESSMNMQEPGSMHRCNNVITRPDLHIGLRSSDIGVLGRCVTVIHVAPFNPFRHAGHFANSVIVGAETFHIH